MDHVAVTVSASVSSPSTATRSVALAPVRASRFHSSHLTAPVSIHTLFKKLSAHVGGAQ